MDSDVKKVFQGSLEDLPSEESSDIILFFSSTFTDMTNERNYILNDIVPDLRLHCFKQGLDFQAIDMRWGVRDEASIDHTTTEIVLNQVAYSKQNSKGPFFVSFLGDRYGSRILPHYIDAKEYKLLRRISMKLGYDVSLMDQWFARDDNAEPSVYYLKSITDILKHYDDNSPENSKAQDKDRKQWEDTNNRLLQMFRGAAQHAYDEKLISRETKHLYFKSVTEAEVEEGILYTSNVKDNVIVYERTLQNIDLKDSKAGRFIDMKNGDIDKEAKDLRERLKIAHVEPKVGPGELRKFNVDWRPGGIDPDYEPHKQYLSILSEDFKDRTIRMINTCIAKGSAKKAGIHHLLYTEVLSHLKISEKKSELFCGRNELLEDILQRFALVFSWKSLGEDGEKNDDSEKIELVTPSVEVEPDVYGQEMKQTQEVFKAKGVHFSSGDLDNDLDSDPNRNLKEESIMLPSITTFSHPVVLYGESGSGKTSVMAKLAYKVQEWYPSCVSVVRFMGTSPLSSTIKTTLLSVCAQISVMYGIPPMPPGDLEGDYQYLCKYFAALLWRIDTTDKPLVIILDSVDQLSFVDNPYNMKWIPCQLPTNVHMVVSMVPNIHNCLENMLSYFPHSDMFVEIPLLTSDVAQDIISEACKHKKRRLTRLQTRFIVEKFTNSPYPLYLKLLLDQALTWKSNTVISKIQVGNSIREAINKIFDGLENKHGIILIQKFMRALAACRMGISKSEVEDVLSLDDEVLQDTYLYHLPPNDKKIRIPLSVLTLLTEDLQEYIVTMKAGHMRILSWYHRHFSEACNERYFPNNCRKATHTLLAEYFEGYWYERVKPLELYKVKKGSFPNAIRNVQPQPIRYMENVYNFRKLSEYPYHLIKSGQFEKYVTDCVCNFDFLYAQIKVLQLGSAFNDLKLAMSTMDEVGDIGTAYSDIETVYNMISLDADCIRKEVNQLASQILSRLGPNYSGSKQIEQLVSGAMNWIMEGDVAVLCPNMMCAPSPGGITKTTFSAAVKLKGGNYGANYGHVMCLYEKTDQLIVINKSDTQKADQLITYSLSDNGCSTYSKRMNKTYSAIWMYCENKYIHLVDDAVNQEELYEASSYRAVQFPYPQDSITVSQSGNLLAFSSVSKIYVCKIGKSIHDLTPIQTLECDGSPVKAVLISPDEKFVVGVVTKKMDVAIFDIKTGLRLYKNEQVENYYYDVPKSLIKQLSMITKDNKLIVKCHAVVLLIELGTGESTVLKPFVEYDLNIVSVHPSEKFVAVGSNSSTTVSSGDGKQWKVWDMYSKQIVSKANKYLHNSCGVDTLRLFGKYHLFAALTLWRSTSVFLAYLGTPSCPTPEAVPYRQLIGHSDRVLQLLLTSDQDRLVTAGEDNRIIVWDVNKVITEFSNTYGTQPDQTKVLGDFETVTKEYSNTLQFAIGRDDKHVYMGTSGGQLVVHHLDDNKVTKTIAVAEVKGSVNFVLISKSGSYIITAPRTSSERGSNVTIKIWNASSYDLVHSLEHRSSNLTCLAEANDILVSGQAGMEAKACVWNIKTGEVLKTFELLYSLYNVAIDSKGTMVVSTFFEFPISIPVKGENQGGYDMEQMDCLMSSPTCLEISPDDRLALCGSTNGQIRVIELPGDYKYLMAQKSSVIAAKFSPDGLYMISTGFKSVYIWNLKDGNLRFKLKKHNDFVVNVQFDRLGKYMITSGRDKKIVYWDVSTFISLASFYSHCQVDKIGLTSDGNKVIYIPENVGHIAVLTPNKKLQQIKQQDRISLKHEVMKAQAMALSFSSQRLVTEQRMSSACSVM